ncbi:hypothetical protein [Ulvibacter litoralis]|uniref:Immunity protein 50 n=1 Tax=Ulvibacter litoralis TaxID=227084 RepID=A0A1G7I0A8_9FLAO|nr:hypothetical protein [Ulvibacter litoralis]GHC62917.1 hypothetical protein GCM10008083_30220 [Ulvibacter litoralis]SDF06075.1 hypothetical protein SAMN05421855_10528 [Ulvibacter litoralis]
MKIRKGIDKILAGFGNVKASERSHVDSFTEEIINSVEGEKIAASENGQIWIEYQELGGFQFLNLTILSKFNIKTKKKCKMHFLGGASELILTSDDEEIESDYSNVSNRWITTMSFDISDDEIKFIDNKVAEEIHIEYKKKTISFQVIK